MLLALASADVGAGRMAAGRTIRLIVPVAGARCVQARAILLHDNAGHCRACAAPRSGGPQAVPSAVARLPQRAWVLLERVASGRTDVLERLLELCKALQHSFHDARSPLGHLTVCVYCGLCSRASRGRRQAFEGRKLERSTGAGSKHEPYRQVGLDGLVDLLLDLLLHKRRLHSARVMQRRGAHA